jgi:hypothetical protein
MVGSVPGRVHRMRAQDVWLLDGANPVMARGRGVSIPLARDEGGG